MSAPVEQKFLTTPRVIESGPLTKADAEYQFIPRIDASAMLRSNKRPFSDPQIEDQGSEGECVGESGSTCCESVNNNARGPFQRFSDQFYYNMAKLQSGLRGQGDTGASIRAGLDGARLYGTPYLSDWPQVRDPAYYDVAPPQDVMDKAAQHKLGRFERINFVTQDYHDIKRVLNSAHAEGLRVIAGINVPRPLFYINGPMATHYAQFNTFNPYADIVGRHAILVEDFDNSLAPTGDGSQILLNSWGSAYGDGGRIAVPQIPFASMVFELWAVRSFNGIEVSPAPEALLTPEQKAALLAQMALLGIWPPAGASSYPPAYEFLERKHISDAQKSDLVGVSAADLANFKAASASALAAWNGF